MNQRQLFLQHVAQTSPSALMLEVVKGQGIHLWDVHSKKYIDLISGIGVSALGHGHPSVIQAIKEQADKYLHTMVFGEYVLTPQVQLATKICSLLPEVLNTVYFTNSGTEATEGAMKLAKRITGRSEIAYFKHAYHGSTQGALSILGDEYFKAAFRPLLPQTLELQYNDQRCLSQITKKTAAVFFDLVQAESGMTVADKDFVLALKKRCSETGTLLVLDEIQTGMGRTGTLFAFEQYGIVPDILLLGKGFGGGLPLGCFISSHENMKELTHHPVLGHITTFGGNPLCCAAALANLNAILEERVVEQVRYKSALFLSLLQHKAFEHISGLGLMLAIHFKNEEMLQNVIHQCMAHGLITDWFLFAPHALRIAPPLIINDEQIKEACEIIIHAVEIVSKH
ncbi:MAG: aspartate aminotransferase family protein [Chitinophagales bacterium]|nr:aspartate aminotransferase family protein [Chitinophagales bacterium]